MPKKLINFEIQINKQREGKKKERKTKSKPQHTTINDKRENKVIATAVWNLIPPTISCSAPFSIHRNSNRYGFQSCSLKLYQEIGKNAIKDLEKESSKHKIFEQNYISKIPKSVD